MKKFYIRINNKQKNINYNIKDVLICLKSNFRSIKYWENISPITNLISKILYHHVCSVNIQNHFQNNSDQKL